MISALHKDLNLLLVPFGPYWMLSKTQVLGAETFQCELGLTQPHPQHRHEGTLQFWLITSANPATQNHAIMHYLQSASTLNVSLLASLLQRFRSHMAVPAMRPTQQIFVSKESISTATVWQ